MSKDDLRNLGADPLSIQKYYDEWARHYDEDTADMLYAAPMRAAEILSGYLSYDAKILDAGCGTGLCGGALSKQGFKDIYGVDISAESIQLAQEKSHYASLHKCDISSEKLPFPENYFDASQSVGVLTYIHPADHFLSQLIRVTKPGGVILLTQREDHMKSRQFLQTLRLFEIDGLWQIALVSEPQPYLPLSKDMPDVSVHYIICKKRKPVGLT